MNGLELAGIEVKMLQHVYSDCFFCGGEVLEKLLSREVWWNKQLHLIDNVPLGVCSQCGQKVILPAEK